MKRISLQTKILGLIIALIVVVTILLSGIMIYIEMDQTEDNIGTRALNAATIVSSMPSVRDAFELEQPSEVLQPIAENVRKQIHAEYIVIGNTDSIRYAHPDVHKLGKKMVGGDNDRALINGQSYVSKATGSLGPALRGKAPIFNKNGDIVGIVSVGFMMDDIQSIIFRKIARMVGISLAVLVFGIIGGIILAKNIRKDTLGLEPYEIASLYRDREAVLQSVQEGIIAVDKRGYISMMNNAAKRILSLPNDYKLKKIEELIPNTKMYDVLMTGKAEKNEEMIINNRKIIVNRTPIVEKDQVVGVVASFRDQTEVNKMLNTLSDVRRYSEDLRAQTHEFTNKLYVLSGLLQLGHYQEAIDMIQKESDIHVDQNKLVFEHIKDKTIQAILLGKISKASEKKIHFTIDQNSSLEEVPKNVDMFHLVTILANLIDNAFEAVEQNEEKQVTFFATDLGKDIIIEIADNGPGIDTEKSSHIFELGFSTKNGADRGYGLASVKKIIDELEGVIEVHNQPDAGALFTVFIPKAQERTLELEGKR
ncbi:sensor histidine kinase [Virgibacillus sp. 179-BFC.A HS]|uniref:histidine kinase n=1 Tax=Tigheibacillus jepli TaxID=3035914 RepID=A0ABU5CEE0_9BACI|nr:sensor histidine kinase [Virgibacillus sp. 179-BFC.A HS]MDY0404366.1 sensor histidine kinase [Virgibacillus sp. 179-BFC.A HS]